MTDPNIDGVPRSIFTDGVEIHDRHLLWTEESKIIEILRRFMDVVTQGVLSGLTVSINAGDNTLIDILAGDGYTRGSVYAELTSGQVGVSLSNYTLNTVNLVTLVASDDDQDPEPHEFDGTVHDTKVARQAVLNIITETAYTALAPAQKDLRLIVARVTGQGAGIPPAPLIPAGLVNATSFDSILKTTQPVNVTGTLIIQVSSNTTTGVGSLLFTFATLNLAWKAPGDALYGSAVVVSAGGVFTLQNNGATKFIRVRVVAGSLPGSNQTDAITITNFYDQVVNRLSANDDFHRSRVGTGIVSDSNAHGLELNDIGGDPEVIEARGSKSSLDDRLDVSLNEDGSLKKSAVEANIDHSDLKNMPDTAGTPAAAVGDHDARYGNVTYSGGPSVRAAPAAIVQDADSHRDSISRLSGELSGILLNNDPTKGDLLVGHNFDAAMVGAGWTSAQLRDIVNLFAKMFNSQDKPVVGVMYDFSGPAHVVVPPQVVNCKGKIRWLNAPLTLNWINYMDAGTIQATNTAYYVYLTPHAAPLTSYYPRISWSVPINGYHPTNTDWIFIGSFVTDGSSNIIPFVRNGSRVNLNQDLPSALVLSISGSATSSYWGNLADGNAGVVPKTAVAATLLVENNTGSVGWATKSALTTYIGSSVATLGNHLAFVRSRSWDNSNFGNYNYNSMVVDVPITSNNGSDKTRVVGGDRLFRLYHYVWEAVGLGGIYVSQVWRKGWLEDLQFGVLQ